MLTGKGMGSAFKAYVLIKEILNISGLDLTEPKIIRQKIYASKKISKVKQCIKIGNGIFSRLKRPSLLFQATTLLIII